MAERLYSCCGHPLPPGVGRYGCANCNGDNADKVHQMTQTTCYTTITDLAADLAETMGLDCADVLTAISANRSLFGRYEDIDAHDQDAISRAVWADVTANAEYPWNE